MAPVGFAVGIQRLIPFIGYHHILMILIAIAIILLCIFLIDFYYQTYTPTYDPAQVDPGVTAAIANIVGQTQLEVRVGYFGLCIASTAGNYLCSNNATLLAEQISIDEDPMNLIWVANTFKNSVVFPWLM
ncbi:unnamed protein product [Aureobasidium pullulans]|nr:unnamed protein product [Aureobasidium pullulans]